MKRIFILLIFKCMCFEYCLSQYSGAESMMYIAESLTGKKYIKYPLNHTTEETLNISEEGFDCVTFVEWVLAKYFSERLDNCGEESLCQYLTQLRYREGCIDGYASRLHYFSEWIEQNTRNGFICDISQDLGLSEWENKEICFLSKKRRLYPALEDSNQYDRIKIAEKKISSQGFPYIPSSKIDQIENKLLHGDIIAFISSRKDLDIAHLGFVTERGNKKYLLHASEYRKRIIISDETISNYLKRKPKYSGVRVLRIAE